MRLAALAGSALALFLVESPARAEVVSWDGSAITSGQQYWLPTGIDIDGSGNVLVTDAVDVGGSNASGPVVPRVLRFTPSGTYLGQWTDSYRAPRDVATAPSGKVYVADSWHSAVKQYASTGPPALATWTGFYFPYGIAVDDAENVYVADSANDRVLKLDPFDGHVVTAWSTHFPFGIAIGNDGAVFVADRDNSLVRKFSPVGVELTSWPSSSPTALATDSAGNVYAASAVGVEKFSADGSLYGRWKVPAEGVAVDADGRVFETGAGAVRRLDPASEPVHAALSVDPQQPLTGQAVEFDASASTPQPLGSIARYEWDLDGDGLYESDTGTSPRVTHTYFADGPVSVGLRVTGSMGDATDSTTLRLAVAPSAASVAAAPNPALTGQPVTFDASGSELPRSTIDDYRWDRDGDGVYETDTGTTPTAARTYRAAGAVPVGVRVTRSGGRVDTASVELDVRARPPEGEVGVSINGGDIATNDPDVKLDLVWPALTTTALISNDGGFGTSGATRSVAVASRVSWRLGSSGRERLPKTVYLRYRGAGSDTLTFSDDIILDELAPSLEAATVDSSRSRAAAARARRYLHVRGTDENAGIVRVEVSSSRRRAGRFYRVTRTRHLRRTIKLRPGRVARVARVEDAAGNFSRWRRLRSR